ncbi:DNA polymerase III subunit delta [Halalkalibacter urbisdiaboli]|uniref:DNA polymerase III subunit delta n=1 Tax=Halalkalibacter urbisdiaboli TaxID=1960589 RepID=UPI000B44CD42|nr:DNA polymerase III subunit delta [Halalkalibacter urbisdiaboli]
MSYLQVKKRIQAGNIEPVYFIYGTQTFLMEDLVQSITKKTMTSEEAEVNLNVFSLMETPLEVITEEAETLPFFGGNKIVIIKDFFLVTSQRNESKIEHDSTSFERYIDNPLPESVVIILAPYEKLDERKKLTKQLKKQTVVVEANPFDEKMTEAWIEEQANLKQIRFTEAGKERLLERQGTNLLLLSSEIDKLSLYAGEGGVVDETMVELLVSKTLEQDVFELINLVVKKKLDKALVIYHDLLKQKEDPLKILALLARQFRIYYQVKEMTRRAYSQKQMAAQLKLHPYVVKLASAQIQHFDEKRLLYILNQAAETDYAIKRGTMDKVLAVELFLMRLST